MVLNVFRGALAFALAGVVLLVVAAEFRPPGAGAQEAIKVPDLPRKAEQKPEVPPSESARIRKLLNEPTDKLRQGIDPGQTLRDVLEFLARSHGFSYRVDAEAFKKDGSDNIQDKQLSRGMAATSGISLGTLLQDMLNQLEPVQGTYIVRRNHITIVPVSYLGNTLPGELVLIEFSKRPLPEALAELSDLTGASIVLDAKRAGANADTQITAAFRQTPLLTVLGLLADMAGLKAVMVANSYYVTTEENADKLIKQGMAIPANVPGPPPGAGGGGA